MKKNYLTRIFNSCSLEQNRTEQNRTEQNRTEQNRTEQNIRLSVKKSTKGGKLFNLLPIRLQTKRGGRHLATFEVVL